MAVGRPHSKSDFTSTFDNGPDSGVEQKGIDMKTYKSHKTVEAFKIEGISGTYGREHGAMLRDDAGGEVHVSREYLDKHTPKTGGYYVRYPDGYESWSPADAFEGGYTEVPS